MNRKSADYYHAQRLVVYDEQHGWCAAGGACMVEEIHHRQGRGGPDPHRRSNLVGLCKFHHQYAHGHPAWAYEQGYMVRRHGVTTTEDTPVLIRGRETYLTNTEEI